MRLGAWKCKHAGPHDIDRFFVEAQGLHCKCSGALWFCGFFLLWTFDFIFDFTFDSTFDFTFDFTCDFTFDSIFDSIFDFTFAFTFDFTSSYTFRIGGSPLD